MNDATSHLTDEICSICLESVTIASDCGLRCKHAHHKKCILQLTGRALCPVCRGPLAGGQLTAAELNQLESNDQLPERNSDQLSSLLLSTLTEIILTIAVDTIRH